LEWPFGAFFLDLKHATAIIASSELQHPTQQVKLKEMRQMAILILTGLSTVLDWMGSAAL
jgi:hypothetical protein